MRRLQLVIMLKQPRAGRVKTRLAQGLGSPASVWWYRHQCASLLRRLRDPRWSIVLAVSPDASVNASDWPGDLLRRPQGSGDLGQRMRRQMRHRGRVCLIGSDIPGVGPAHIARAFRMLGGRDAVFGPAEDGGFWLVGWHNGSWLPRTLFRNVRWSTQNTLADTLDSVPGVRYALLETLRDVDRPEDLKAI